MKGSDGTGVVDDGLRSGGSWAERRLAAAVLTAGMVLAPVLAGVAAAVAVGRLLVDAGTPAAPRFALVAAAAWVVHAGCLRAARRLLPLRALLRLAVVFPGSAPSRWLVGLRATLTGDATTRLARLRGLGPDDADAAAELVVQLAGDLSRHDALTRGHSERVRDLAAVVGRELKLSAPDLERLRWAALLHDIGKLAVDAEVLNKRGPLDRDEWEQILAHPDNGYELIGPLRSWLGEWALGVLQHHERIDGEGYPSGLAGDDIALSARIISVVDAFDVMTSARSYKRPMRADDARAELTRCAGSQFDPDVVRAFLASGVRSSLPAVGLATALPSFFASASGTGSRIAAMGSGAAAAAAAVAIVGGAGFATASDEPPTAGSGVTESEPVVDLSDLPPVEPGREAVGETTAPVDRRPHDDGSERDQPPHVPEEGPDDGDGAAPSVPAGPPVPPVGAAGPPAPAAPPPSPADPPEPPDPGPPIAVSDGRPDAHPAPPPPVLPAPAPEHPLVDSRPPGWRVPEQNGPVAG